MEKGGRKKLKKMPSSRYQYEDLISQSIEITAEITMIRIAVSSYRWQAGFANR